VYEVATNQFLPLLTPLFFGWTITLKHESSLLSMLFINKIPTLMNISDLMTEHNVITILNIGQKDEDQGAEIKV
jgi:hypothetical protein